MSWLAPALPNCAVHQGDFDASIFVSAAFEIVSYVKGEIGGLGCGGDAVAWEGVDEGEEGNEGCEYEFHFGYLVEFVEWKRVLLFWTVN